MYPRACFMRAISASDRSPPPWLIAVLLFEVHAPPPGATPGAPAIVPTLPPPGQAPGGLGAGWARIGAMRAAIMRGKQLVVDDLPLPEPGPGEVLVRTLACGICGSDLHALKHG